MGVVWQSEYNSQSEGNYQAFAKRGWYTHAWRRGSCAWRRCTRRQQALSFVLEWRLRRALHVYRTGVLSPLLDGLVHCAALRAVNARRTLAEPRVLDFMRTSGKLAFFRFDGGTARISDVSERVCNT